MTLSGTLRLLLKIRTCRNKDCRRAKKAVRPFGEGLYSLLRHEFGLDVIAQIGAWRYREHASVPDTHRRLQQAGVPICERTVSHLLDRYDELVALSMLDPVRLSKVTAECFSGRLQQYQEAEKELAVLHIIIWWRPSATWIAGVAEVPTRFVRMQAICWLQLPHSRGGGGDHPQPVQRVSRRSGRGRPCG